MKPSWFKWLETSNKGKKMKKEQYDVMLSKFVTAIRGWNATPGRGKFSLAQINVNIDGRAQVRFSDPDTDNAWIGFQMAETIRVAELKNKEQPCR